MTVGERRFLLLHGWQNRRPPGHWQFWLAERLRARSEQVLYPQLPRPDEPLLEEWAELLAGELAQLGDGERVVICHSLSCLLWAHAAPSLGARARVDRLLWVAPPGPSAFVDAIATFAPGALAADAISATATVRELVCGDDDPYCPEGAERFYGPLGFTTTVLAGAGHLDPDAGYGPWPAVERWALGDARAFRAPGPGHRALSDPGYRVPEAPAATGGVAWLRASVARFCEGADHARRRALAGEQLAGVSPARLRSGEGDPVEVLAEALGLPRRVAPDVAVVAGSYQPHTEITEDADRAVDRLIAACGGNADEATASRIGLLVQACPAVDSLIAGANPPVPVTRRVAPSGELVEVDLTGIAFSVGRHACPGRAHALALASSRLPFHRLHHGATPLILPNAWDFASAAALVVAGFSAIGTTSLGVAAANGLPDAAGATLGETLELARRLVRLPLPITVDVEAGLGADPRELAAQLWDLRVAGVNIEDGRGDRLVDPAEQADLLRAFKDAAPAIFLNARIDTHWLGLEEESTIDRARRYADAGADGVFVPGLVDDGEIAAVAAAVALPLNVLAHRDVKRLADLGVRRISTGSLLYRAALGSAIATAEAVRDGSPIQEAPTYEAVEALSSR